MHLCLKSKKLLALARRHRVGIWPNWEQFAVKRLAHDRYRSHSGLWQDGVKCSFILVMVVGDYFKSGTLLTDQRLIDKRGRRVLALSSTV
jgi:hypothetical protein